MLAGPRSSVDSAAAGEDEARPFPNVEGYAHILDVNLVAPSARATGISRISPDRRSTGTMMIERSREGSATREVVGAALVLVVEHVGGAPLGSLRAPLVGGGVDVVVWNASSDPGPPVQRFDGLIVLGGGANPDGSGDAAPLDLEQSLIRQAHADGTPVLGICLGAQLASLALGGRCFPAQRREHGWCDVELTGAASTDSLLRGLDQRQTVMQWHAWAFEPPPGATELVGNAVCSQGFRAGHTTWGFQFHPEVSAPQLEAQFAASRSELAAWGFSADQLLADTHRHLPAQLRLTATVAERFARAVRERVA